jgi:hypothetical protein
MPTEFVAFLGWLASAAGVGAIKSEILEHEQWFQNFSEQGKSRFIVLLTIALSVGAYLLSTYVVPMLGPEWLKLITLILTPIAIYLSGQAWHDRQTAPQKTQVSLDVKTEASASKGG